MENKTITSEKTPTTPNTPTTTVTQEVPINPAKLRSKLELSIRRKDQNAGLPGDDAILQNPKIGSSLKGQAPLSGLDLDDERKYLPEILNMDVSDIDWRRTVREYWNNISERVPHDKEGTNSRLPGRLISFVVEFKTEKDKALFDKAETFEVKAAFIKKGEVISGVPDFVLFMYCLSYGKVANRKEDMYKSGKILFYLYSQETEAKKQYGDFELRRQAKNLFETILEDEGKLDAILRVFGEDPTDSFIFRDVKDKHLKLDDKINENPRRFISFVNDKSLIEKALIKEAVLLGIIHNPVNTDAYYYGDDKQIIIGNTLVDAVLYLKNKDERNTQILESIKSQVLHAKN